MKTAQSSAGFSLVEVALAVAIVAFGVAAALGLLPALVRQSGEAADTQTALRLTGAIEAELERRAVGGFDAFAGSIPVMSADSEQGLKFTAARDGTGLRLLDPAETPARDQHFLLVVRRFPAAPLAYDPSAAWLATNVLVVWPYRVLTPVGLGAASDPRDRQTVDFNVVVSR